MSDTPRTDALRARDFEAEVIVWETMEILERQNAELRASGLQWQLEAEKYQREADTARCEAMDAKAELAALSASNEELRLSHAAIYRALGTQEANHTKWPELIAALSARVAELDSELLDTKTGAEAEARHADELQRRNAELVAALRDTSKWMHGKWTSAKEFDVLRDSLDALLACAESAAPAKHPLGNAVPCENCGSLRFEKAACFECEAPAKHPDTVRLDWLLSPEIKYVGVVIEEDHHRFEDIDVGNLNDFVERSISSGWLLSRAAIDAAMKGGA